ncbi:MAG: alpha-amylase [Clostridia bacterium]|nr:alpha-amylase [Clostridia bacterium]
MQYFEWYLPSDSTLWNKVTKETKHLENIGITHVWLPPAYKGAGGKDDVGYGVYDLYDLGEFDQKGSIPTKYGTKDEYVNAIRELRENNIKVLADIVLNHKMGADETEEVLAVQDDASDRNISLTEAKPIKVWTKYTFPGRGNTYSDFKWNWTHFHGVDWDENTGTAAIYKFYGKHWDEDVDKENGNFDYLMGADIDLNNYDVIKELKNWGKWYINTANLDGFRLDAVKHIRAEFFPEWLEELRNSTEKKLFSVGEYWSSNIDTISNYIEKTNGCMSLFDVPLHYNFYRASISNGEYDMSQIFEGTIVGTNPEKAVTFVDNHDTEPGQALESWILDWFKPLAYSLILLRKNGFPCVFYGDYYGIPEKNVEPKKDILTKLLKVRKYYAYGEQYDYFNDRNVIGFTRLGDYEHHDSGLAVVMSDGRGGGIQMNVGKKLANTTFYDCTGNLSETVYVDNDGNGIFYCKDGSVSVWIKQGQSVN